MKIKLCVVMDPIESIHPEKDTTLAFLLEAQKREFEIHYLTAERIFMQHRHVYGLTMPIRINDQSTHFVSFLHPQPKKTRLETFDIILLRKDPPFNNAYLYATYLLEYAEKAGCFIVNNPTGVRNANEKLFSLQFPSVCPETCVAADPKLLKEFLEEYRQIVVKPLDSMGGNSVFYLAQGDRNINSILEQLTRRGKETIVAQRYIPAISAGDKRILMIDGKPYPYALTRLPAPHDFRGNLAAGGTGVGVLLSDNDHAICAMLGPVLKAHGLFFVGLDVIGDYLTEINVTSPTCVREIDRAFNVNVSAEFFDRLMEKFSQRKPIAK